MTLQQAISFCRMTLGQHDYESYQYKIYTLTVEFSVPSLKGYFGRCSSREDFIVDPSYDLRAGNNLTWHLSRRRIAAKNCHSCLLWEV